MEWHLTHFTPPFFNPFTHTEKAMLVLNNRLTQLITLLQRHSRVVALFGFLSGAASFFMVNRQNSSAGVIVVILLLSWLWLVFENVLTQQLTRHFSWQLPPLVLGFITKSIHQESLFFVLPFFAITTTWNSGQLFFTTLLGGAALVSIIDPIYNNQLVQRRWIYIAFHTFTLFAVMLTALPIIFHLTTSQSYQCAMCSAVVFASPSLFSRTKGQSVWVGALQFLGMSTALILLLWFGRHWVPPSTLWLTNVIITTENRNGESISSEGISTLTLDLMRTKGIYAYTTIKAPRGLNERIYHLWRYNGREVDRIPLDISGGRKEGYRTWTHKMNFPENPLGKWQIEVVTEAEQLIGVVRFQVTE